MKWTTILIPMEQRKNNIVFFILLITINVPIISWSNSTIFSTRSFTCSPQKQSIISKVSEINNSNLELKIFVDQIIIKEKIFLITVEIINNNDSVVGIPKSLIFDPRPRLNSYFIDIQIINEESNNTKSLPLTNIIVPDFNSIGYISGHNKLIIKENLFFRYNKLFETIYSDGIIISARINFLIQIGEKGQLISLNSNEIRLDFKKQ